MYYKQMTSKDIWNLFNSGKLDLNGLGKGDLDAIYEVEMEELERNSAHDMSLMEKCADILMHKYSDNVTAREFTIDDIAAIEKEVLSREHNNKKKYKRSIPKRRLIAYVAAAALIIAALGVVVAARFDLFGEFGVTIRDLFHMGGDKVANGDKDLSVDDNIVYYKTYEELSGALGINILQPNADVDYDIVRIYSSQIANDYKTVFFEIIIDGNTHITYEVFYGEGAQKEYGENLLTIKPSDEWNGYNIYYFSLDGQYQANLYHGDMIYIFTAEKKESIEGFLNTLE